MRTADVAIIGGGVIGCSIAYHLTQAGVTDVAVLERQGLAGGATSVCGGGIRQQFDGEADCLMVRRSLRFFERINDILEPETAFTFERCGYLFLADSDAVLDRYRRNVALQNGLGIPTRLLTPEEVGEIVPALDWRSVKGGTFCGDDGFVEDCDGVTKMLARRARDRGARVLFEDARTIERRGNAWALVTSGGRLEAQHVVLAAGAEAAPLAEQAGVHLPIVPKRRRQVYTGMYPNQILAPLVVSIERGFAGKQRLNGTMHLGWLAESADFDDFAFAEHTMQAGASLVPELAHVPVRRVIHGTYDMTPDHRPILGRVEADDLFVAAGFSGHGYMMAPAVGEILAGAIARNQSDPALASFSARRFASAVTTEGLQI